MEEKIERKKIVGNNIIKLRKDKGYEREDVAKFMDVSKYTFRNWELGKYEPSIDSLIKLSEFFNVTVDELVKDTRDPKKIILTDDYIEEYLKLSKIK